MQLPEAVVLAAARNREATARLAWSPYMHNPKLKARLRRIDVPALILWGAADRIVLNPGYGRAFCSRRSPARGLRPSSAPATILTSSSRTSSRARALAFRRAEAAGEGARLG